MANWDLTTYAGLKSAIADTLNRTSLTDQIPGFIALHEAKMNRELRVRDMQMRATAVTTDEFIPVPADFLAVHSLQLQLMPGVVTPKLDPVGENEATDLRLKYSQNGYVSYPTHYTIFGGSFEVIPAPAAGTSYSYDLKYYAKLPALSDANPSNWLLLKSPDLYLYGACLEAAPYLKNDDRINTWGLLRNQVMDAMKLESDRARFPQARLRAQPRGF